MIYLEGVVKDPSQPCYTNIGPPWLGTQREAFAKIATTQEVISHHG